MTIITYALVERTSTGAEISIETGYGRATGLARFAEKLRQNAEHYPHKRRLVLIEDKGGAR